MKHSVWLCSTFQTDEQSKCQTGIKNNSLSIWGWNQHFLVQEIMEAVNNYSKNDLQLINHYKNIALHTCFL